MNLALSRALHLVSFAMTLAVVGCSIMTDRSSHYGDFVGADFATRKELFLLRLDEYQYGFVPLTLAESPTELSPYSHLQEKVPAGARIKVIQARYRPSIDAGFDYFIAELFIPGRSASIRFEQFVGDPSDASSLLRLWRKIP